MALFFLIYGKWSEVSVTLNNEPTFGLNKALNNFKNSNMQFSSNNKNVKELIILQKRIKLLFSDLNISFSIYIIIINK